MEGLKGYLLTIVMGLQDENKEEVTGKFYQLPACMTPFEQERIC
jgi:hypothetical protein